MFGSKDERGIDFPSAVAGRRYCKMEADDDLRLIGRISNIIKLSNGEFISQELIEDVISSPTGVAQCMVVASSRCSFVAAIVVPVNVSVCSNREEQDDLYSSMLTVALQKGLRPHEIPLRNNVKFVVERWNIENGCLNAAMKLNRSAVVQRYQKDIDDMLAEASKSHDRQPPSVSQMELTVENLCGVLSRRTRSSVSASDAVDDIKFLGQDSLAIVSLLHEIRSVFALPFLAPHHWFSTGTLSGFLSNIKRLNFSTCNEVLETIPAQVAEDDAGLLQITRVQESMTSFAPICSDCPVLLTGTTGFLGVHLLQELLKQNSNRLVYCIIRSGNTGVEGAYNRLVSSLVKYNVELSSSQMSSVRVLAGDIALPQFGLGLEEYRHLTQEIGCVYHNASEVNWLMTYSQLRASNVIGTLHAIQFAVCGRLKWLHYVSTLNTCDGASLLEKPFAGNGYQQSKWVAERLVHQAVLRGLNATVCRPGTIGPHSVTGACNVTDFSSCFLLSIAQNGIYLDSNNEFEMSPVDNVASAIVTISMQAMRSLEQPHITVSSDCVSSASSLSDKAPSASPRCANPPLLSRTSSCQMTAVGGSPRVVRRTNSTSSVCITAWQKTHCFNLSHCAPVLSNQGVGSLVCELLQLPPRPVGHETFFRLKICDLLTAYSIY
jgi:thioester reductase-like protein